MPSNQTRMSFFTDALHPAPHQSANADSFPSRGSLLFFSNL